MNGEQRRPDDDRLVGRLRNDWIQPEPPTDSTSGTSDPDAPITPQAPQQPSLGSTPPPPISPQQPFPGEAPQQPPTSTRVPSAASVTAADGDGRGIGSWSTGTKVLAGCGVLLLLCVLLGTCGGGAFVISDRLSDEDSTPTARAAQPTVTRSMTETVTATDTATATIAATHTPTATATVEPTIAPTATRIPLPPTLTPIAPTAGPGAILQILDVGAGQPPDDTEVGWSFIVQNTESTQALSVSSYTITLKDENDVVLDSNEGFIDFIFPGQTLGVSGSIFLDEGQRAARIEVETEDGEQVEFEPSDGFVVTQVTYFGEDVASSAYATGLVSNPFDTGISRLFISAVPYDADGNIIGGGFTFMGILPAGSSAGTSVPITSPDPPAYVEIYATTSSLSDFYDPDSATDIVIGDAGFGQDGEWVGWAAILQNQVADQRIDETIYQATFFDADGRVLEADWNALETLLGGQTLGISNDFVSVPTGTAVSLVQIDVLTGEFAKDIAGRFTIEDVQFVPDDVVPRVTGVVTNPFDEQMESLDAVAVVYDENDDIIGAGSSFMDILPALGQTLADVSVTGTGTVARVELYVTFSILTDVENIILGT